MTAPDHLGCSRRYLLQRLNGRLSLGFLVHAQNRVDHDYQHDDNGICKALSLVNRRDSRHNTRSYQHQNHRIHQL